MSKQIDIYWAFDGFVFDDFGRNMIANKAGNGKYTLLPNSYSRGEGILNACTLDLIENKINKCRYFYKDTYLSELIIDHSYELTQLRKINKNEAIQLLTFKPRLSEILAKS